MNTTDPSVAKMIEGLYHDHSVLELLQIIEDQEIVYQSLQRDTQKDMDGGSSSNLAKQVNALDLSGKSTGDRNSSQILTLESQLQLDEAVARALQEEEDRLAVTQNGTLAPVESPETAPILSSTDDGSQSAAASTSAQVVVEDNIDPDNMSYECTGYQTGENFSTQLGRGKKMVQEIFDDVHELQSLGEAVGTESKGLPDDLISLLETSRYKTGFFSRKDKNEKCVICCMPYKNRDKLIHLPCKHYYHAECITTWLKMKKECPVCKEEIFG